MLLEPFVYEPLSSPYNIRLLRVTLTKSFTIECELTEAELSEDDQPTAPPPKYSALSYTWGDDATTVPVLCNGRRLEITSNLAEALDMTLAANPNRLLWVDQICINQRDNDEKASQVKKMTLIYDRAQSVLAWIGPSRPDTGLAVNWISRIAKLTRGFGNDIFRDYENSEERQLVETLEEISYEKAEELGVSFHDDAAWAAFSAFYDRPWFQRIWVVQEVLPAREALVICGSHSVEWHHVKAAAAWYTYKAGRIKPKYDASRAVDGIAHCRAMNLPWRLRMGSEFLPDLFNQQVRPTYQWAFDDLLSEFRNRLAGDPRDKIFALLGISTMAALLNTELCQPDYEKPVMQVFRDATRGFIESENGYGSSLNMLLHAVPRSAEPGWPTWVPDWRITDTSDVGGSLPESQARQGRKAKHHYMKPQPGEENELHVEGHVLGTVVRRSRYHHIGELLMNLGSEHDECRGAYADYFSTESYTPTGENLDTAWAMSLQGGRLHSGFQEKGTTAEKFGEILVDMIDTMKLPRTTDEEEKIREGKLVPYREHGLTPPWLEYWRQKYCERRWFITDSGFVGIGNYHMEDGDVIAEIWGLDTSCVLRPVTGGGKDGGPRRYEFVGEAYCHGARKRVEEELEGGEDGAPKGTKIILV